ncbi:hypothetical protein [Micromonospora sp. NPDC047074]|uniref:hypothetical protein n=1 Tax=Micromonospora sp. NPDC047074 TaxID=3154339 RepID=UPI0033C93D8E
MSHADLTLSAWLDLSDGAAARTAADIARSTEAHFAGTGLQSYVGRTVRVGFFDRDRATSLFRRGDEYPEGEPYGEVPLIREPNLFGLVIGDDPYRAESTTDPAVLCGGDGGEAMCGGYGSFLSWLTLATAYRNPDLAEAVHDGGLAGETPVRPVPHIP